MDTIKITDKKQCRIIAHRGLSYIECENTMPSFVAAANRSYYGIETDVHVTSDGKYVVIHDNSTGRVAAGNDISVEENTFDTLRNVLLADKNGLIGRTDLRIPSLSEYVTVCKRYGKIGVLELKNRMSADHIYEIVQMISNMDYLENMIFISFHLDNMIDLRRLLPNQKLQWLTGDYNPEIHNQLKKYKLDFDVYYKVLNREVVELLHRDGIEINCWTCDNREEAEHLIQIGVDYITTNMIE